MGGDDSMNWGSENKNKLTHNRVSNYLPSYLVKSGIIPHKSISDVCFFELYFGLHLSKRWQEGDKVCCSAAANFAPKTALKYTMKNSLSIMFIYSKVVIEFFLWWGSVLHLEIQRWLKETQILHLWNWLINVEAKFF